jgi:Zn-dependent protease with chaperone function
MCLLGVACAAAFAGLGPRLASQVPPRTATHLLVGGAGLTTAALLAMLALLGITVLAQVPQVASAGGWSTAAVRTDAPLPGWAAVCCLVLLGFAGVAGSVAAGRHLAALRRLRRVCRDLDFAGTVVVLHSERPDAFATTADGGHVVVTTGMLNGLHSDEVQVLLAHEHSHLHHRHAWWMMAARVCGAANPMLTGVVRAAGHAIERWADEDAARVVGDRRLVARTLARAALHVHDTVGALPEPPTSALGAMNGTVLPRVRSMLGDPPRPRLVASVALTALVAATLAWSVAVQDRTDDFLDSAHAAQHHSVSHIH